MTEQRKKLYNPFNMLGSWIGALILYLYSYINIFQDPVGIQNPLECCFRSCGIGFIVTSCKSVIIWLIFILTLGFLVGWGIHVLIRKFKK